MNWPKQRIFPLLFFLLFLSAPLFSQATDEIDDVAQDVSEYCFCETDSQAATFTGKVVGISEGNTISVMRGRRAVKVGLYGIDWPEKRQAYGTRAKLFASDLACGKEVTVRIKTTDRYGRIIGEVILPNGTNLNWELIHAGMAWWHRRYAPEDLILKALEAEAREAKRGLWADCCPIPPWEWRHSKGERRKR